MWFKCLIIQGISNAMLKTYISLLFTLQLIIGQEKNVIFLTHWGWVMLICVSIFTIIGSIHALLAGWCQAIIWTNAEILLNAPLGTDFNEIII